jgi:subtilisin family serine protease
MPYDTLTTLARRRGFRRATLAWLAMGLAIFTIEASAQLTDASFEMGKKTTTLEYSDRFETVTFYEERVAGGPRTVVSPAHIPFTLPASIGRPVSVSSLEQYGVLLIQLAPGVDPREVQPAVRAFNIRSPTPPRVLGVAGGENAGHPIYSVGSIHYLVVNEVLVRFKDTVDEATSISAIDAVRGRILVRPDGRDQFEYLVHFPGLSGHETIERSNKLDGMAIVEYAQPNFVYIDPERLTGGLSSLQGTCASWCPDTPISPSGGDPLYGNQWHLANDGASGKKFADINAERAWQITLGSPDVVIAILDDLVEEAHQDLEGKVTASWNAITQSGSDSSLVLVSGDGHGTSAAGLAVAVRGNGLGVAGIAPRASIARIRTHAPTSNSAVTARGINHAANIAGVRVLSMSWTLGWATELPNGTPAMENAIASALTKKLVLVFAAGNDKDLDAIDGREADYPASRASELPIIAVSATDKWDALQKRTGPTQACGWTSNHSSFAVSAPGVEIHTTDRMGAAGYCAAGEYSNYAKFSGTSAATPLVAGIAALMLSKEPGLTPSQVKARLQSTAKGPWKRVDACRALQGGDSCNRTGGP